MPDLIKGLRGDGANVLTVSSASVGISTEFPTASLDIRATSDSAYRALHTHGQNQFFTTTVDASELRFQFDMGGSGDAGSMNIYKADASTIGVHLDAGDVSYFTGGNLGIGTTNPTQKLEVLGSTILKESSSTGTALQIKGAGTQGAVSYTHLTLPTNREV